MFLLTYATDDLTDCLVLNKPILNFIFAVSETLAFVTSCDNLKRNHDVDSVSDFLDESLTEISGEPNFGAFCETQ